MTRKVKTGLIVAACLLGAVLIARLFGIGFGPGAGEPAVSFKVGNSVSRTSTFSGASSSSSENATFKARRVLLVSADPHPLSRGIAALAAMRLEGCRPIEQLDVAKGPEFLAEGAEAPDFFLRIDLVDVKESGLLSGSVKTTVAGFLGSAPWRSSHHVRDDTTPPTVQFAWNVTLENETTFTGVRSDRYGDIAHSIAVDFAKGVSNELQKLSSRFPVLPELPRDFYGPYEPVADFDFLKEVQARRACSYYGLLNHNETFWRFQTPTNPVPQLQRLIAQLKAAGWKVDDGDITNTPDHTFRAARDGAELEFFRLRTERVSLLSVEEQETAMEFIAHHRKPFSRAEREAALEKLFAGKPSIETLLVFQHSFSSTQRDRFFALVEKMPAASPRACIALAESYLYRKQTNSAVNMLLRAKALATTVKDASALESKIESMAKKISPKQKLTLEVTAETCRELGFLEITNALQTIEAERDLGRPLLMFGTGERGLRIVSLTVQPPVGGAYPWILTQSEQGARSTSSSSFTLGSRQAWEETFTFDKQTLKITAAPASDRQQVKYTVRAER